MGAQVPPIPWLIDGWSVRVLTERAAHLTDPLLAALTCNVHHRRNTAATPTNKPVCVTVRDILTRAGLSDDNGIRLTSPTAYAARREFDRTGRIERRRPPSAHPRWTFTAALIGYTWHDPGGATP